MTVLQNFIRSGRRVSCCHERFDVGTPAKLVTRVSCLKDETLKKLGFFPRGDEVRVKAPARSVGRVLSCLFMYV